MNYEDYEYIRLKLDWTKSDYTPYEVSDHLSMNGYIFGFSKDDKYLYTFIEETAYVKTILEDRQIKVVSELPMKHIPKPKELC